MKKLLKNFIIGFFSELRLLIGGDGGGKNYMKIMNYYGWKLHSEVKYF